MARQARPFSEFPESPEERGALVSAIDAWLSTKPEYRALDAAECVEIVENWAQASGHLRRNWAAVVRGGILRGWAIPPHTASSGCVAKPPHQETFAERGMRQLDEATRELFEESEQRRERVR